MANPLRLHVSNLPPLRLDEETSSTTSPARGREMLDFLHTRLHQKTRAPPLVHSWDFWHDRQERQGHSKPESESTGNSSGTADGSVNADGNDHALYEDRLEFLARISDVRQFWSVFNNFDILQLKLRDSIHLFHKGVKPLWEDGRNRQGGCWTFRVPKHQASDFWREVCLLAIGEKLQEAVDDPARSSFLDDICGISLSVRFHSMLVQIWNRDGAHTAGIQRILSTLTNGLSPDLAPKEGFYYYKKHCEHAAFRAAPTPFSLSSSFSSSPSSPICSSPQSHHPRHAPIPLTTAITHTQI